MPKLFLYLLGCTLLVACNNISNTPTPAIPAATQKTNDKTANPAPSSADPKSDEELNYGIKNIMKTYPTVHAEVDKGEITLQGEIKRKDLPPLMMSLNSLHPKNIVNNLKVK